MWNVSDARKSDLVSYSRLMILSLLSFFSSFLTSNHPQFMLPVEESEA